MIGIIVAAIIIAPNLGTFTTINQETTELLETAQDGECTVNLNENVVFVGEEAGGTIHDGANTLCEIYASDGTVWYNVGSGTTNSAGDLSYSDSIETSGTYSFRAICGSCVTNIVYLKVNPLPDDETPEVGDNVGSGSSGSGNGDFGDDFITSPIMLDWTTGGPYVLGAKITRSWNYVDPQCEHTIPQQYPMEWTLYDSNGMAWQKYDYVPVNNVVDTICPLTYHEDSPWKFIVSVGIQDCEVEYSWNLQPYICEVNE